MINATIITGQISPSGSRGTTPENSVNDQKENTRYGRGNDESEILDSDKAFQDLEQKIDSGRNSLMDSSSVKKTIHRSATTHSRTFEMEGQNVSSLDQDSTPMNVVKDFRVFVATWNVGGKSPDYTLDLEGFLHVEGPVDIYVLGFQEIVPLNAGNVLVIEDSEPAARWTTLISQALNKPTRPNQGSNHMTHDLKPNLFHKPSMKNLSRNIKADDGLLKACNCEMIISSLASNQKQSGSSEHSDPSVSFRATIDNLLSLVEVTPMPYCLVASKQMVGLFISVWARKELVQHIGHLEISCVGTGIMGYLGNKGCISVSFTFHRTSFCFVCSHLASGEKEGDEVRRNSDVAEILKNIHFPRNCKNPGRHSPERIIDHDRILWFGDLNYRMALSYEETRMLLENNDSDSLLKKDQLNIEREAGRVFNGWSEGKISFAPTYKYSQNSDSYAGENVKSKKNRRTPAWCDRILWRGNGIEQLLYIRGESRFSDHRPVCGVFAIEVEMKNKGMRLRKGFSSSRLEFEDCIRKRHSFGLI